MSSTSVARVREFRARTRRHGKLIAIEIPGELPLALCEAGFLAEWDCENPVEIRKAIEKVLARMTEESTSVLQVGGVWRHVANFSKMVCRGDWRRDRSAKVGAN